MTPEMATEKKRPVKRWHKVATAQIGEMIARRIGEAPGMKIINTSGIGDEIADIIANAEPFPDESESTPDLDPYDYEHEYAAELKMEAENEAKHSN